MVQIKYPVKSVMVPLALTSLMFIDSCKKTEEVKPPPTQTDLLLGDWKITDIDGNDYSNKTDYSMLFKFSSSGDWKFCYEYTTTPANNYCYTGKWRWEDSTEKTVIMDQITGEIGSEWKLDIVLLDANNLNGNVFTDLTKPASSMSIKFVKVK